MTHRQIVYWSPDHSSARWHPTTLDQLGKDEQFFEHVLAASPNLLGLGSRRTGIRGPFRLFQQVAMETPSGRSILPDIVLFSASGHVIVVEVKRFVNPELRQRAVIAQIIDYASSFAALSDEECLQLFAADDSATWTDFVARQFPEEPDPEDLANALLQRMQAGELHLVIACDKVPPGLPEVVSGVASQSTLSFHLDLVEVVPYVVEVSEQADILFVPSTRLRTEIVSRTAVTVTYREGDAKPSTSVQTTSLEDIEENLRTAAQGGSSEARSWSQEEVEQAFHEEGNPTVLALLDFAKQQSVGGKITSGQKTKNATFGLYVRGLRDGTQATKRMVFTCTRTWPSLTIYSAYLDRISDESTMEELRRRLRAIFGASINADGAYVGIPLDLVGQHLPEFQETILWFKRKVEASLDK